MAPSIAVLCVGINEYPDGPLDFCKNDAMEVKKVLHEAPFSATTTVLVDRHATRRAVVEELRQLLHGDASVKVFFFAGHGGVTELGTFLVTYDGDEVEPGLDLDVLRRMVNAHSVTGHVLVILDCCHSGSFVPWQSGIRPVTDQDLASATISYGDSRALLAACRPDQLADEDPSIQHGLFTHALLRGLRGEAADHAGEMTVSGLHEFVSKILGEVQQQVPVFRGDVVGRFVVGAGFAPMGTAPTNAHKRKQLELQAKRLLDGYSGRGQMGIDEWLENGFRRAAKELLLNIRWFQHRLSEHADMKLSKPFMRYFNSILARRDDLSNLDEGTRLDQGTVGGFLGQGGFGAVWRVDTERGPLALKVFSGGRENEEKLARFEHGYFAMKSLDHPRIVRVYEYSECPVGFFMDFVDGPNLRKLGGGGLNPLDSVHLLVGIAETLQHAHVREVVHRDVKPENILLRYDGEIGTWIPYLCDFDLAWFSTATSLTKEAMGTFNYAAPEQLAGQNLNDSRGYTADVFSFGQISYFLLVGDDPTPSRPDRNRDIIASRLDKWTHGGAANDFLRFYLKSTSQEKTQRHQNFREVIEEILAIGQRMKGDAPDAQLEPPDFLNQIVHAVVGLRGAKTDTDIVVIASFSGRTECTIRIRDQHKVGKGVHCGVAVLFRPASKSMGADRASTHMSTSILMQRPWRHAFERAQVHSGDGVA
jgi:hypothetical protein